MEKQSDVNTERRVFRTQRGFEVSLLPKRILSVTAPAQTKLYSIVRHDDFRLWTEPFLRTMGGPLISRALASINPKFKRPGD